MIDSSTKQTKHIILVSIDNLRFDCIGYQPNKKELRKHQIECTLKTSTLDAIAEKSTCFSNVISTSTYTTASHASIITGLYPPRHGVRAFYDTKLSANVFTLAELLKNQGYLTALSTDALELWKPLDLHRGFTNIFERQDKEFCAFLDSYKNDKVFAFIHFLDVHEPYIFSEYELFDGYNSDYYDLLEMLGKKYKIDLGTIKETPHTAWKKFGDKIGRSKKILFSLFVKGVSKFDNGRFNKFITYLEHSSYMDDSLIIIFSDHGEGRCIDDVNFFAHAGGLYDDVIKVPLIIYGNDLKHKIVNTQVSTVDIFPTILDVSFNKGISIPYKIDGQSLMPEISGINGKNHLTYSEVWITKSEMYLGDGNKGSPHVIIANKIIDPILYQRAVRTEGKKYLIYGKPDVFLDISAFDLSNEDFIKKLYRCLLGRIEDCEGFEHYLKNLNQNIQSKEDVLASFLNCEEYKLKKKFVMFDLEKDAEELNPIDPLKNHLHAIEFFRHLDIILTLEKQSVFSEKIFGDNRHEQTPEETFSEAAPGDKAKDTYSKEDEEKIKERLKSLGYLS